MVAPRAFNAPRLTFGEPIKGGLLSITVTPHHKGEA